MSEGRYGRYHPTIASVATTVERERLWPKLVAQAPVFRWLPERYGPPNPHGFVKAKLIGEIWALLFFDKPHAKEDLKIVWRITGSGKQFNVQSSLG